MPGDYAKGFSLGAFFDTAPWPEPELIGGWFVKGYNARDEYDEIVVKGAFTLDIVKDWKEWYRVPIRKDSALLKE